jgi:hypothetical protein
MDIGQLTMDSLGRKFRIRHTSPPPHLQIPAVVNTKGSDKHNRKQGCGSPYPDPDPSFLVNPVLGIQIQVFNYKKFNYFTEEEKGYKSRILFPK